MFVIPSARGRMCTCNQACCDELSPTVLLSDSSSDSWTDDEDDGVIVLIGDSSPDQSWFRGSHQKARRQLANDRLDAQRPGRYATSSADPTPETSETSVTSSPGHIDRKSPDPQHRRKRARRAVPYEFTAPSAAGELRYADVATIGHGVVVKASSIKESGNGLFADRDFRKGELITEYYGEILDRDEVELRCQLGQFQYIGTLRPQQYYIDGIREPKEGCGGASFINHSAVVNSVWHEVEDRRICFTRKFARATRDIKRGEEIFVNYGRTYWTRMRRWHDTIEQEGLENISDFEGDVECDCEYTDYMREPNKPPAEIK